MKENMVYPRLVHLDCYLPDRTEGYVYLSLGTGDPTCVSCGTIPPEEIYNKSQLYIKAYNLSKLDITI